MTLSQQLISTRSLKNHNQQKWNRDPEPTTLRVNVSFMSSVMEMTTLVTFLQENIKHFTTNTLRHTHLDGFHVAHCTDRSISQTPRFWQQLVDSHTPQMLLLSRLGIIGFST